MLLKYVSLNIRSMLKNHLGIFLLILLSEIAAALCILFSYGLVMKMQEETNRLDDMMYYYRYELNGQTGLKDKFMQFIGVMESDLDDIIADVDVVDKYGENRRACVGKSFIHPENNLAYGCCDVNERNAVLVEDGKVILSGEVFNVREIRPDQSIQNIGNTSENAMGDDFLITFDSIPEAAVGKEFEFYVNCTPTKEKVGQINSYVEEIFGVKAIYTPEPLDLMKKQESNTFYAYALLIVIIVIINLSMYFRYIAEQRRRQIRIFILCGAEVGSINIIFLVENLIELVVGYAAALAVFRFGLLGIIDRYYPYFSYYYSARVYLITFVIFVIGSMLILTLLISPHIRKTASAGKTNY